MANSEAGMDRQDFRVREVKEEKSKYMGFASRLKSDMLYWGKVTDMWKKVDNKKWVIWVIRTSWGKA